MNIHNIYIKEINNDKSRIVCDLTFGGENKSLWFETDRKHASEACIDRVDGVVVALLPEILLKGEKIYSDLPISNKLYYNLSKLIPILVKHSKGRFALSEEGFNDLIHCKNVNFATVGGGHFCYRYVFRN